jgi:uncharacterized membrane protein YhaH (DUF805 family)
MQFKDAVTTCLNKYINFSGRASRSEYWWFILFVFVASLVASMISPALQKIVAIAAFLPCLSAEVRRLHDINRNGWWCFIVLIPIIGILILIIWLTTESNKGVNYYGNEPA